MTELNDMGRTEDIALGINLFASIGFAEKSFGSDRDATLLRATVTRGWEAGRPGGLVQLGASTSTRHEHDGFKNSVTQFDARYYLRNSENRLLSLSLSALATHELDPETQVLLGGDNGLRGYPIRYQAGENRIAVHRRAALLHGLLPVATVPVRLCGVLRRRPGNRPRSTRVRAARHALRHGLRTAPHVAAREPRPDPAHRSRVPDQRAADDRQSAADRRDERNVLTPTRNG